MSPRGAVRTGACSDEEAASRLRTARKFVEVAELVADEGDDIEYSSQAASLAVLAGIAASDAACCKALGHRARGQDHREAATLIARIDPDGKRIATSLRRLLSLKDEAHYGLYEIGSKDLRVALRQARSLLDFAGEIVER
jgi:hypothetical protein